MVCAAGGVKSEGRIVNHERGRADGQNPNGRTNPFRMQAYAHHRQGAETGHRMNPGSTLRTRSRLATKPRVMNTGVRGFAGRRWATSLPLLRSAGYIGDALSDRVVRVKHFKLEEIESCFHIAFVSPRGRWSCRDAA